jgi:hypothetical protein
VQLLEARGLGELPRERVLPSAGPDQQHLHAAEFRGGVARLSYDAMLEPGLDRHEWESRWASLEEELADSPRDVLPELDALVGQMLEERGFAIDDPVAREGEGREVVDDFFSAREITQLLADDPDAVSPGDVAAAVNSYRSVYEFILEEDAAP